MRRHVEKVREGAMRTPSERAAQAEATGRAETLRPQEALAWLEQSKHAGEEATTVARARSSRTL